MPDDRNAIPVDEDTPAGAMARPLNSQDAVDVTAAVTEATLLTDKITVFVERAALLVDEAKQTAAAIATAAAQGVADLASTRTAALAAIAVAREQALQAIRGGTPFTEPQRLGGSNQTRVRPD